MQINLPIVLVVVLIVIVIGAIYGQIQTRKRREGLAELAQRLGLDTYSQKTELIPIFVVCLVAVIVVARPAALA